MIFFFTRHFTIDQTMVSPNTSEIHFQDLKIEGNVFLPALNNLLFKNKCG